MFTDLWSHLTWKSSRSDASTRASRRAFSSLITFLSILTLSVFGSLTVKTLSASSPSTKQLRGRLMGTCSFVDPNLVKCQSPLSSACPLYHIHQVSSSSSIKYGAFTRTLDASVISRSKGVPWRFYRIPRAIF